MRRSMKRLKTFKHIRPTEGASTDPNAIPLESIGGKNIFLVLRVFFLVLFTCLFDLFICFFPFRHVCMILCPVLCFVFRICLVLYKFVFLVCHISSQHLNHSCRQKKNKQTIKTMVLYPQKRKHSQRLVNTSRLQSDI